MEFGEAKDRETVELGFQLKAALRELVQDTGEPLPSAKYVKPTLVYYCNLYKKPGDVFSRLSKNLEPYSEKRTPDQFLVSRIISKTRVNAW